MAIVKFASDSNVKILDKTIFSASIGEGGGGSGPTDVFWSGWSTEPNFSSVPNDAVTSDSSSNLFISDRTALTEFVGNNGLFSVFGGNIDARNCTNLNVINIAFCSVSDLNVSGCFNLSDVNAGNNALAYLDVSGLVGLQTLQCNNNNIESLNISGCTNLVTLFCYNNSLASAINVSGFVNLQTLDCNNNSLKSINASGCTNLETLICSNNALTSINVSGCANLNTLECQNNSLTQSSIDQILADLDSDGVENGNISFHGGSNSSPSALGLASIQNLESKGWSVTVN